MTAHLLPRSISTATSAVIGATSIAPLYSVVVTLGLIHALVGRWTPVVLVAAVVPMVTVSVCFARLDELYEDQGTVYRWAREAYGAFVGFRGGWGLWLSATLVLASLAWVTADSALFALGADPGPWAVTAVAAVLMAGFAAISSTGIRLSAAVQAVFAALQLVGVGVLVWATRTAPVVDGAAAGDGEWSGFYTAVLAGGELTAGNVAAAWMTFSGALFDDTIGVISVLVALYYGPACAATAKLARTAGARALGVVGAALMAVALVLTGLEYVLSATCVWVGAMLVLLVVPLWFLLGRGRDPLPGARERAPHLESLRN